MWYKNYSVGHISGALLGLIITLFSCKNQPGENNRAEVADSQAESIAMAPDGATSQNSIDFIGTYRGVTPCADCEGIEISLTLNADSTFNLSSLYLGKGDGKPIITKGKYNWNTTGSGVELEGLISGPSKYKVGEGRIWQLDMEGKIIEGELAEKYILNKL